MRMQRHYTRADQFCLAVQQALRTINQVPTTSSQPYPAENKADVHLSEAERKHVAGLMRVNHAGEVCAQALYQGQGMTSMSIPTQEKMQQAAQEEIDHLLWCKKRLDELNSHPSYLGPFWYVASFGIGLLAGKMGDRWSLGFVAETEQQVFAHLESHLKKLPQQDLRSQAILQQMATDEARHRDEAKRLGARVLPKWVQRLMRLSSKIMVKTAYFI